MADRGQRARSALRPCWTSVDAVKLQHEWNHSGIRPGDAVVVKKKILLLLLLNDNNNNTNNN